MLSIDNKQCKSENCTNPVLKGKYCEHCKLKMKDRGIQVGKIVVSLAIVGGTVKGAISGIKSLLKLKF